MLFPKNISGGNSMKKTMCLFLCLILTGISLFAGGASQKAGGGAAKLEIMSARTQDIEPDKDVILQELKKQLAMDFVMNDYSGDDYTIQINARMASGNYPDIFQVTQTMLTDYARRGLLLDLTDAYKNELLPLSNYLGDRKRIGAVGGKNYGIPTLADFSYDLDFVRKDWLDKLNLKTPVTVDDLYNVAVAFTNNDPDGNGKKDTYGLIGEGLHTFASVFGSYGVGIDNGFPIIYIKNGQLVSGVTDPDAVNAITAAKRFIDAGVVDPELFGNTEETSREKAWQGTFGIIRARWSSFKKDEHIAAAKAVNPNAEWAWITALKNGNNTSLNGVYQIGASTQSRITAIPAALAKNPEKLALVYKFFNYLASPAGARLVQFGIEGSNYRMNNGKMEPIDFSNIGNSWYYQFLGREEMPYLSTRFVNQLDVINSASKETRIEGLNGFVTYPDGFTASDAETYINQELVKFLYGQRPLSQYNDFLNTLNTLYNFKAYIDNAKTKLTQQGILK
jgi:putative aldouronate transport system substrate-binding protein